MKKIIYSTLSLFLIGFMALTGCKSDGDDDTVTPETPKPLITFLQSSGYTFANATVLNTTQLKFGMVVSSTIDLKSIKVSRNLNGSGEVFIVPEKTLANNTLTYNLDVLDTLDGVNKGSYVYTFYATDKDATLGTAAITITATGPLVELTDNKVYNNKGAGFGAFDLVSGLNISTADPANVALRDIVDASTTSTLSRTWTTVNGTKFIKNPPGITWSQTTTEDKLKAAYELNASLETTTVTNLDNTTGTMVLAKVIRTGVPKYFMIIITDKQDLAGADDDFLLFDYKY